MRLIDADALKNTLYSNCDLCHDKNTNWCERCCPHNDFEDLIDNAPTVEEIEEPFITECRNTAIEKNLPLYFVYYEETGIFEVYITETKELFEKRHCSKQLPTYDFQEIATRYLDAYSEWRSRYER